MYKTNAEPRPCACGGKSAYTPSILAKHKETLKHRRWRWRTLCEGMLDLSLSRDAKIAMLRELKTLVEVD
jgi:hypothetical protein